MLAAAGFLVPSSGVASATDASSVPDDVRFGRDVMAVLSKAGCNTGGCHGAQAGKGGFRLSLFGENPAFDYEQLRATKTRFNPDDPDRSWLLRKPTLDLEHEGGRRFEPGSPSHEILRRWIAAGGPPDPPDAPVVESVVVEPSERVLFAPETDVALRVEARFSDGTVEDVTGWAVYESSNPRMTVADDGRVEAGGPGETTVVVRYLDSRVPSRLAFVPDRPGFVWPDPPVLNVVDRLVDEKLRTLRVAPAPVCDDATFVRRVHLDLAGIIPDAVTARAFVADPDPGKRAVLVDRLLESPEFADFWALKWADLLKVEENTLDSRGVETFHGWIRDAFAANKPLDQFVWEILTARGSTYENPPSNFYRALRDPTLRAEAVAQVFLGTRLQCARCHNHPFERWTQDDYYRFSALFDGIGYRILENKRRDGFDKSQFVGEQVVYFEGGRELRDPRDKSRPSPGLLEPGAPGVEHDRRRFADLADWLAAPDNRRFAAVQANRIWYHLFGRGIVDPVDDFRSTNPPSNPALLDALADEFVAGAFDVRHLVRLVTASRTYQASAIPGETNRDDAVNFARAYVRRLDAEVLLDSINRFLETGVAFHGVEEGTRAVQVPGVVALFGRVDTKEGDHFLKEFGKPQRLITSDLERSADTTLAQVFQLTSGATFDGLLREPDNRIGRLIVEGLDDGAIVDRLFWAALSRAPRPGERSALVDFIAERSGAAAEPESATGSGAAEAAAAARRAALEDVAWGLVNSKEFLFRH